MTDVGSPQEVCRPTPVEEFASILAELAVAYVEPDARKAEAVMSAVELARELSTEKELVDEGVNLDEFLDALASTTPDDRYRWRAQLSGLFSGIPPARLSMWLADNCITSRLIEEELLVGGSFLRRLDAVLDLADVPFCAADVQSSFADLATSVAAAKTSGAQTGGFRPESRRTYFFHPRRQPRWKGSAVYPRQSWTSRSTFR